MSGPGGLDVEHGSFASFRELGERGAFQVVAEFLRDVFPSAANRSAAFPLGVGGEGQKRRLHRIDNFPEVDGVGFAGQEVASAFPSSAFDQSGAPEIVEDLHEKVRGHGFALREFVKPCNRPSVMTFGQLGHRAAGVIELLGNPHGGKSA